MSNINVAKAYIFVIQTNINVSKALYAYTPHFFLQKKNVFNKIQKVKEKEKEFFTSTLSLS